MEQLGPPPAEQAADNSATRGGSVCKRMIKSEMAQTAPCAGADAAGAGAGLGAAGSSPSSLMKLWKRDLVGLLLPSGFGASCRMSASLTSLKKPRTQRITRAFALYSVYMLQTQQRLQGKHSDGQLRARTASVVG